MVSDLQDLLEQVKRPGSKPRVTDVFSVVLPRCTLNGEDDLVLATGLTSGRLTLIELMRARQLTVAWPSSLALADHDTIASTVHKYIKENENDKISAEQILAFLADECESDDTTAMREELASIYQLDYIKSENHEPPQELPMVIRSIVDLRLRMSEIRNTVVSSGASRSRYSKTLDENISELDSLGLVSMNTLLYELQIQLNIARKTQEIESNRQVRRDRRVSQLVSAFVLPSLWLSFLGMTVIPMEVHGKPLQTPIVVAIAAIVSVVLALIGWFLIRVLGEGKAADAK